MRRLSLVILLMAFALVQSACDRRRPSSVLVVAIDSLPFGLSLCARETEGESGLRRLCEESIRFTHASTTSPLSVPAMASLLTGQYPIDHGVRHNGVPGLSPSARTFAETAVRKNRRTAFFSGGAPVWRRTGLHQGFETFDDGMTFTSGRLFRGFAESSALFSQWLAEDVGAEAFSAVFYVPDLVFTDTATETATGELRNLSYDSQLEELDESLGEMFRHLIETGRWNDTVIVVVGLNGREISPRPEEIEPLLLNSENMQVSLFIKPLGKPRDQAIHWKIDRNVSLADVGRTLLAIVDGPAPSHPSQFISYPLTEALHSAQPDWPDDRLIALESGWAFWQGWGPVRMAALTHHDLVFDDEKPVVYNTLVDRLETSPQPLNDDARKVLGRLEAVGSVPWPALPSARVALFRIQAHNWLTPARGAALHRELRALAKARQVDDRTLRWAAQSSLEQRDWELLSLVGKRAQQPLWVAVAERNLGKKSRLNDPCLDLLALKEVESRDLRSCPDETFLSLQAWFRSDESTGIAREAERRRFLRAWEQHQMDLRILKTNAGLGLLWLPASAEETIPSRTSLALALPEMKKFNP